ncbi:Mg2+-importing ATPase [Entomoplasma freundtii]|uniref:Magnesium-transporting ATPase, P-type 1 n=1 Tax=Entomoplasma freundtii TaxID=74700 RepID=A0A2K8NQM5_9MOLU|nr:magnesium-translocating P-type ATPase [Entomoplasma freundtii]ATZ16087.1 Mg(2+) transport ATPase, P-type [Entomoplasma freundtii]TDY57011.1 Mg2+-importing ATPase [Entomoplasma freundtii]
MVKEKLKKTPILKDKKRNSFSNQELIRSVAKMDQASLLKHYNLERFGLDEEQYEKRKDDFGKNELDQNPFRWLYELAKAYFSPFNVILLVISAYNFASYFTYVFGTEDERSVFSLVGAIVVLAMVMISGTITFIQSYRGYFVTKKLRDIISNQVNVIRYQDNQDGKKFDFNKIDNKNFLKLVKMGKELPVTDLVPGDLIYLSSGDMIPADVRLVYSNDLFINQSSLTGESLPVEKHAQVKHVANNVLEIENICYTGTSVIAGSALAIVAATGSDTYFSSIGEMLNQEKQPEGSFLAGVRHVTRTLLIFMLVMVPLIYFVFIARNHANLGKNINENPWFTGLFFAIALVVALTPEMLPLIITTNLSNGAARLTKEKVVVKRMDSIQSLGAIDILATDKTGTLTNDKIELISYSTVDRKQSDELLKLLFMNSYFQTGLKNPMDRAIVDYTLKKDDSNNFVEKVDKSYIKIDEIPFDFNRRKLTIVFQDPKKERYMVTKGSVEEVLQGTNRVFYEGEIRPLTENLRRQIISRYEKMNERGERVLGIAYKPVSRDQKQFKPVDEKDLIFFGFASFLDSPKPSAAKMINLLKKYGVDLKILTGDNEQVTRAICNMVGLNISGLVSGQELEEMTDHQLQKAVEKANVFVKLSPSQKVMVLEALKQNGHNVGYMGDGINDAPVLFQADVAISVNNAADIAKEASDIILLEKNLGVLERGIIEGRTVFGNILKYMKITIASQFGNALSMIIATAAFGNLFLAMSPIQTLFQNLIYDFSQLIIAFDYVDEEFLMKPRKWTTKDLIPFAIINGSVSSIFDVTTYMVMGFGFHCFAIVSAGGPDAKNAEGMFQAACFLVGLTTQASIMHVLRTEKLPIIQSRSPWYIYLVTFIILVLAFAIVFTPSVASLLDMKSPSLIFLPIALAILMAYLILAQLVKMLYIHIFHKWL